MLANGVGHPYVCCDTTLVVGTIYELRGIKHLIPETKDRFQICERFHLCTYYVTVCMGSLYRLDFH